MIETGILQFNCGNANNEKAKAVFDSIDPTRFPILAIQEPMITERRPNVTYIPKNFRPSRPVYYGHGWRGLEFRTYTQRVIVGHRGKR